MLATLAVIWAQAPCREMQHVCVVQVMRMHILDDVRQRIEDGLREFISEIRVCTVVFLGIPSLQARRRRCMKACSVYCI